MPARAARRLRNPIQLVVSLETRAGGIAQEWTIIEAIQVEVSP